MSDRYAHPACCGIHFTRHPGGHCDWTCCEHDLSPVSPAPVTTRAADEHDDRPGSRCKREPGRSASTT